MNARARKIILLVLAAALLAGSGRVQTSLNRDRERLGLTRASLLENAPPLLAFTTVALGGFRGLISNYLWIRSNDLQLDDKFFEAAQLANWITDLEPHFEQVWVFEAWNMAFNISVKFKDFSDRWRWLEQGIELLRDRALRYNPDAILIYRELASFFQFKIGGNLDDANLYYKQQWAREMTAFFGPNGTNVAALVQPQTPEDKTNALVLREKYRIDPAFAQKLNEQWGPLDWRLPEAHAIYWAERGLAAAEKDAGKLKPGDLMPLRRVIYQSLQQSFYQGRLIASPFIKGYALGPYLDFAPQANRSYEVQYAEETDPAQKDGILKAQRNFLRNVVYILYENNRLAEAAKWYKILSDKFPDKPILDSDPDSFPRNLTLDEYAVRRVQEEVGNMSQVPMTAVVQGLLTRAYYSLAMGQDDRYEGFKRLATRVYESYRARTAGYGNEQRIPLPPFADLNRAALEPLLDPQQGLPYAARAIIRTQLGLPAETNAPSPPVMPTNTPSVSATHTAGSARTNPNAP